MAPNATHIIDNIDLSEFAALDGPFTTVYVSGGDQCRERARLAIDRSAPAVPAIEDLLDVIDETSADTQVVARAGSGTLIRFKTTEPLHRDLARHGPYTSFGSLLDAHQMTTPHAVVTVEDDVFAITTFGHASVSNSDLAPTITESITHAVESLRFGQPSMIAIAGRAEELESAATALRDAFPLAAVLDYPTDDLDGDLPALSDAIVRDATSRQSERVTHELGSFRVARSEGLTVEGVDVVRALEAGAVRDVLVHDDPDDDRSINGGRLIDAVVHGAIASSARITIIPSVPPESGPNGGIGAVLDRALGEPAFVLGAHAGGSAVSPDWD